MTNPTTQPSQAARDAAAAWCASQPFPSKQAEAPMIRAGEYDHHSLVQAFARFECDTEKRVRESLAGEANVERVARALTHTYEPHPEYPWFCEHCGYPEHERLKHPALERTTDAG